MIDNDNFIQLWKSCKSTKEVAEKSGMTYDSVASRAKRLRQQGYDLDKKYQVPDKEFLARIGDIGRKSQAEARKVNDVR